MLAHVDTPRSRPLLINLYVNIQLIQTTNHRYTMDLVNNGVAWKTPSCICSCQWCTKSEVFCGNCWTLRRRLEAATGCRRGPQYDGKCSFYLNCYFFRTSPTNRDLREKAVYFPRLCHVWHRSNTLPRPALQQHVATSAVWQTWQRSNTMNEK